MELLYIYIERFNHIKEQEFHFSYEFDIHYNKLTKTLTFNTSQNPPVKLFNEGFLNINAIIGKNGSGKTSLLSFIQTLFCREFFHHDRFILVLRERNKHLLIVDKLMIGQNPINCNTILDSSTFNVVQDLIFFQSSIYLISQSNSFSIYEDEIMGAQYSDISFDRLLDIRSRQSNKLLIDRYNLLLDEYKDKKKDKDFNTQQNVIINATLPRFFLYHYELLENVNFVTNHMDRDWSFIPKLLDISFNYSFLDNNIEYFNQVGLSNQIKNFEYLIFQKVINLPNKTNSLQLYKDNLILLLYLFCVKNNQYYHPHNLQINESIININEHGLLENLVTMIKDFFKDANRWPVNETFNEIREFINNIDERLNIIDDLHSEISYRNSYTFSLSSDRFNTFIRFIFKVWLDNDFMFNFSWHGLSAGEAALLNMFSRIHTAAKYDRFDNIWILIDEGDLYLHPEWQRTFLFNLHKNFPDFFEGKKIQLLLTSHSPFLVSDLPPENIILLDKDMNGWAVVQDNKKLGNTFGANIHTLFTNAFFLNKGLIGEFAKKKITELFNEIQSKNEIDLETYKTLQDRINIIGEPVIKDKLLNLINSKILKNDLAGRRSFLEEELKKLDILIKKSKDEKG